MAALLSFITPGLGQLYNGDLPRALLWYLMALLLVCLLCWRFLTSTPWGLMFVVILLPLAYSITMIIDAFRRAKAVGTLQLRSYNRWYVYLSILLLHVVVVPGLLTKTSDLWPVKPYRVGSGHMLPALLAEDRFMADVNAYAKADPKRGDIAVVVNPALPWPVVMRVMALPGEVVEFRDGNLFINGQSANDPWGKHCVQGEPPPRAKELHSFGSLKVAAGEYFMLGDKRDNSFDSRFWGAVGKSSIKAKALYLFWSVDKGRIGQKLR